MRTVSECREIAVGILSAGRLASLEERGFVVVDRALLGAASRLNFVSCVIRRVKPDGEELGRWAAVDRDGYWRFGSPPPEPLFTGSLDDCIAWATENDSRTKET